MLRHLGDEFRHGAAWDRTLRENAEFIYKAGGRSQPVRLSNTLRYPSGKERYKFSSECLTTFRLAPGFTKRRGLPQNLLRLFASIENQSARR